MPVTIKSTGGGSVTMTAASTASDVTLTLPATTGTVLQSGTTVTVAQGGTGATTLTANNVILGNGTSAVQFVAPGTNGNILTSNGTTWTSAAPAASGVTSVSAGNGITVSGTTAVTVSQDIYTGSTANNTSYPIGSYVCARQTNATYAVNSSQTLYSATTTGYYLQVGTSAGSGSSALTGTWRSRGYTGGVSQPNCDVIDYYIFQRTA